MTYFKPVYLLAFLYVDLNELFALFATNILVWTNVLFCWVWMFKCLSTPDICHRHGACGKTLSCGENSLHVRWSCWGFLNITNFNVEKFSTWEISTKSEYGEILCTTYGVQSHFTVFFVAKSVVFCDLRCFVARTVWSLFTCFCMEKIEPKLFLWRKDDKY